MGHQSTRAAAREAYLLGRDEEYVALLERAHQLALAEGDRPAAARDAWWIGHNLIFRGRPSQAAGWWAVGSRLLDEHGVDCVERGYLLIPDWLRQMGEGDWEAGLATAVRVAATGERFGDADLVWLARDDQARALVHLGRVEEGLRLVDELLVVVASGVLSPVVSGIVYCNTIAFCRDVFQEAHAREWTDALTTWCAARPGMVAHNGLCLVHRAEIFQARGAWVQALDEARTAAERFTAGALNQIARGKAYYRQGEIHRLQGRLDDAERCYDEADRSGCQPQPGRAMLRLAQGASDAAAAALRRALAEQTGPLPRAALLPDTVTAMLAVGDLDAAEAACRELGELVRRTRSGILAARTEHARACVALARGEVPAALAAARASWQGWHQQDAPYDAARARVLIALSCRALGDEETARTELRLAREVFADCGAVLDIRQVDELLPGAGAASPAGLSVRELEVLRLVAAGSSNRQIAGVLVISERTVARHLQNIFAKLGVSSRTAASSFAYEHHLV